MANIILPAVPVLNEIDDSTKLLIEQAGEINRYPISDLDIGGGDITIEINPSTKEKPQSPLYSTSNDTHFYPLTTVDQVICDDGSRLNNKLDTLLDVSNITTNDNGKFLRIVDGAPAWSAILYAEEDEF
jgi:hypothetical protein